MTTTTLLDRKDAIILSNTNGKRKRHYPPGVTVLPMSDSDAGYAVPMKDTTGGGVPCRMMSLPFLNSYRPARRKLRSRTFDALSDVTFFFLFFGCFLCFTTQNTKMSNNGANPLLVTAVPMSSTNPNHLGGSDSSSSTLSSSSSSSTASSSTSSTASSSSSRPDVVVVANLPEFGRLLGRREQAIDFFGGIPYAAPPVGPLRWAPPEPAAPWAPAKLDATQFGPDCWQIVDPLLNPGADVRRMSEDCLYLNVYTPAGASSNRGVSKKNLLPVMVWLHGGAFQQGGARRPEYDGRRLAERGTVIVTINYRLGALGFLVSSTDGLFGNFGLMDQRAALHWVRDNIQHFGGDPDNITLFGESAGAVMTVLHLLMESNNGDEHHNNKKSSTDYYNKKKRPPKNRRRRQKLFHKAIIQSNPLGLQFRSIVVADFIGEALKRSVDCRDLQCLRAERVEDIMRAQSSLMGIPRSVGDFFTWGPTLTQEFKVTIGAPTSTSSGQQQTSSTKQGSGDDGLNPSSSSPFLVSFTSSREQNIMFRDLDSWKWKANRENAWASVNVTQPLNNFDLIPDDIPIIIGVNKHEGEMFVHGAFPITMSKAVYWMFVGALFRDSASRVLKHYRGYVDQIEKDAEDLARKQIQEEECRQFYLENQEVLDKEYQYLLDLNATREMNEKKAAADERKTSASTARSGYEALLQTWGRGGGDEFPYTTEKGDAENNDFHDKSISKDNNQCLWYERMWPFRRGNQQEWELKRIERRKLKEERKILRAKDRALKEAAKVVVDYRPVMSRIIDDYLFRCPAWNLAHKLSRKRLQHRQTKNNVFVYQFSHSTHIPGYKECWGKACHTSELPFVFEAMDIIRSNYSTLGPYAQQEAPESPEYPYTDILAAYRGAMEAADRTNAEGLDDDDEVDTDASGSLIENRTTSSSSSQQQLSIGFQRLLSHFFGDYFKEDADEEIASDMAERWVSFARSGDPNYQGSQADWRPWRKVFDDDFDDDIDDDSNDDEFVSLDDGRRIWRAEDFDEIFDLNRIIDTVADTDIINNSTVEGDFWFDDPVDRMYRRRALIALGMEVVEEDVFKTLLRRTTYKEETDNPFHALLHRLSGSSSSHYLHNKKGGKEKHMRRAIRQLQQIAQDMGFIGTGVRGEPRRVPVADYWEDAFFPEIMELKWPPEGRLVERDCTCDMWDRIRYRY